MTGEHFFVKLMTQLVWTQLSLTPRTDQQWQLSTVIADVGNYYGSVFHLKPNAIHPDHLHGFVLNTFIHMMVKQPDIGTNVLQEVITFYLLVWLYAQYLHGKWTERVSTFMKMMHAFITISAQHGLVVAFHTRGGESQWTFLWDVLCLHAGAITVAQLGVAVLHYISKGVAILQHAFGSAKSAKGGNKGAKGSKLGRRGGADNTILEKCLNQAWVNTFGLMSRGMKLCISIAGNVFPYKEHEIPMIIVPMLFLVPFLVTVLYACLVMMGDIHQTLEITYKILRDFGSEPAKVTLQVISAARNATGAMDISTDAYDTNVLRTLPYIEYCTGMYRTMECKVRQVHTTPFLLRSLAQHAFELYTGELNNSFTLLPTTGRDVTVPYMKGAEKPGKAEKWSTQHYIQRGCSTSADDTDVSADFWGATTITQWYPLLFIASYCVHFVCSRLPPKRNGSCLLQVWGQCMIGVCISNVTFFLLALEKENTLNYLAVFAVLFVVKSFWCCHHGDIRQNVTINTLLCTLAAYKLFQSLDTATSQDGQAENASANRAFDIAWNTLEENAFVSWFLLSAAFQNVTWYLVTRKL